MYVRRKGSVGESAVLAQGLLLSHSIAMFIDWVFRILLFWWKDRQIRQE